MSAMPRDADPVHLEHFHPIETGNLHDAVQCNYCNQWKGAKINKKRLHAHLRDCKAYGQLQEVAEKVSVKEIDRQVTLDRFGMYLKDQDCRRFDYVLVRGE